MYNNYLQNLAFAIKSYPISYIYLRNKNEKQCIIAE